MKKTKTKFQENFEAIVIAILLALFIRTVIVEPFKIPSGSMIPTLLVAPFSGK
jgi:signal peptidase I